MSPRRVALATAALLTGLLAPVGTASGAQAAVPMHAELVSTTPKDGATVESATQVTMTFSEDVNPKFLEVRVEGPAGEEADGPPVATSGVVTQDLVADLPAGTHTVTYRVVSVDGHPVSGTFLFTSTAGPASATATPTQETTSPAPSTSGPVVVSPGPSASPVPTSTSSEGVPGWLVPLVLAIIAVLVIVPALLLARRRQPPADEDEHEAP